MRFEQMQYFVETVKTGSISLAAKRLHISQPSVSQAILHLEKELGAKLLNRSRNGVACTPIGRTFFEKSLEVLNKVQELQEEVGEVSRTLTERLSIAAIPSICTAYLPQALLSFQNKYPKVHIEISEDGTNQIIRDVISNQVDLGLVSWDEDDNIHEDEKLEFGKFFSFKYMVCVGKRSSLPIHNPMPIQLIKKQPIILFKRNHRQRHYIEKILGGNNLNVLFTSGNTETTKKIIADGISIGFYPDFSIKRDAYVHSGEIIPLEIEKNYIDIFVGWVHAKNKRLSKSSKEFLKNLQTIIINTDA